MAAEIIEKVKKVKKKDENPKIQKGVSSFLSYIYSRGDIYDDKR